MTEEGGVMRHQNRDFVCAGLLVAAFVTCSALTTSAAQKKQPDFGPNVMIFSSSTPSVTIQKEIDNVYAVQRRNEFGPQRNAFLFLPGTYHVDVPIGFNTQVIGLGASPDDVRII